MFEKLSYEQFAEAAQSHKKVAVYMEIPGDRITPISAYIALTKATENATNGATLLESSLKEKKVGRYSHLCFEPVVTIKTFGDNTSISYEGQTQTSKSDPFEILRKYQQKFFAKTYHPLSGFAGGMVGYLSYDAVRLIENIPNSNDDVENIPDILFRFYANNITFDHQTGKIIISRVVDIKGDLQAQYDGAIARIEKIIDTLLTTNEHKVDNFLRPSDASNIDIETDLDDKTYCGIVDKVKQYVVEGDVFQAVPSRKFSIKTSADPFDIYRALRFGNPSSYMFYLDSGDFVVTGASPEKLISVSGRVVESRPLAGTRPRNSSTNDDEIAKDLLADNKEVAEHMMLVDLARNDIGSIAIPGSVNVARLKEVEKYSRVMHISSTVQGVLRDDLDALDALKASFPAGTLTGAPKIRAMEIIDEVESSRRGMYGGAICAIDSVGNLESCIAIRSAVIKDGVASVRAGAGVVFDSVPQKEADETRHKASAILAGILSVQGEKP